jgi:hypothetical protein
MKSSPPSSARITFPLLLRNSLWVSFRVIKISVARVLRPSVIGEKTLTQVPGKAARRLRRQDAEVGATGRDPGESLLEHGNAETMANEITNRQGSERAVGGQVGAEQRRRGSKASLSECILHAARRQVNDGH